MLMRTRNLGVVGTRGAGEYAHTMGPYYPREDEEDIYALLTEVRPADGSTRQLAQVPTTGDSIVSDEENKTKGDHGSVSSPPLSGSARMEGNPDRGCGPPRR